MAQTPVNHVLNAQAGRGATPALKTARIVALGRIATRLQVNAHRAQMKHGAVLDLKIVHIALQVHGSMMIMFACLARLVNGALACPCLAWLVLRGHGAE
jgi:hypothetical protein